MKAHGVRAGKVTGSIEVPGSRSITNRALVVSALAGGRSTLIRPLDADDTVAMRTSLRALGVTIDDSNPTAWFVDGSGGDLAVPPGPIDVGASGTTARFITAVAALAPGPVTIAGSERMKHRPIADLLDALTSMGGEALLTGPGSGPPLIVGDPVPVGRSFTIDASRSSQFVSSVAMIAPLLVGDTEIRFKGNVLVSRPYVEMTLDVMSAFGAEVEMRAGPSVFVRGSTGYLNAEFAIEPDVSAAVYPAGAAAVSGGTVEILGMDRTSRQADIGFFEVLAEMGCSVEWFDSGVRVSGPEMLSSVDRDMNSAPDAALAVAVVSAFAEGTSTISNIGNLRIKESDRLTALQEQLQTIGIVATTTRDSITIHGGAPHGGRISTYEDHRIAMSFAMVGVAVPGIAILDPDCVSKTWPGFFAALDSITEPIANVGESMDIVIALDGPGGSGKTTVSRAVGQTLELPHLDTGAFYRAATLVVVESGIDPDDSASVAEEVSRHEYGYEGGRMLVDGRDVSAEIRTDAVTKAASPVSAIPEVRRTMVAQQRAWVQAAGGSAVVEGRDIGTVVFPDADLKVYLTARPEVRAARRANEQGHEDVERVTADLDRRDTIDSTRADSPLSAAEDALVLDTSEMTFEQVCERIISTARARLGQEHAR
jgi:3-phosphoshikimate 1-carboxyvinyltransferase